MEPLGIFGLPKPAPDRNAVLDFMPGTDVPVIRQRYTPDRPLPLRWRGQGRNALDDTQVYDLTVDPEKLENRGTPHSRRR